MTLDAAPPPVLEQEAVAHLRPDLWARATRHLAAKALAEFAHELLVEPVAEGGGAYVVRSDGGEATWRFTADVLALEHWLVDPASVVRVAGGEEQAPDVLQLAVDLRTSLGLEDDARLGVYLEELSATLSALAFRLGRAPLSAEQLAGADFQTIESRMVEGHPCFVANSGRIGWDVEDFARFAPEAGRPVRLLWVAAHRDCSVAAFSADVDEERFFAAELGPDLLGRFAATLRQLGLDLADYVLVPVHPWQWRHKLAVTFAADVAQRRLVLLGEGEDDHLAQQSIRTFFNAGTPSRHYTKTAMSVVNMGFVRGLSAAYMEGTPAINDWVARLVAGDRELRETCRFEVLREVAAVGYRTPVYAPAGGDKAPYAKMLAGLWRESPAGRLGERERVATMASLLHTDGDGRSLAAALIRRSGLSARAWVSAYLHAYLRPLLHCFFAYELVFMPHGENLILVLEDDVPRRVLMKDIAEEVVLMDPARDVPDAVRRIQAEVPEELKVLSIFTDVVDCFLRFLAAVLHRDGALDQEGFWAAVRACVEGYQDDHPELAERFAAHDLLAPSFARSCLNRLQLRDPRQMVDLDDPAGALQLVGTLENPIARWWKVPGTFHP
ncbi:IucA/IucC family siderophore biosynthesis protein [Conexibacter sp. SYSU D00693]|uniref:IucA/IucC family protein n=1 Tax=Conexibacter sp. SYSU D00693 TaxID=2812560 RepID=UPI00196B628E|nr:IucA/IucC family protein [Conexibacter sp. SYSU D00693]